MIEFTAGGSDLCRVQWVGEDGADRPLPRRQAGVLPGMFVLLGHLGGTCRGQQEARSAASTRRLSHGWQNSISIDEFDTRSVCVAILWCVYTRGGSLAEAASSSSVAASESKSEIMGDRSDARLASANI